ncbi:hypothetical protein L7F22_054109, partial [Adiantum nelumboides]|nr:hypothetical protein [Adiantum nelumboides]
MGEAYSTPSPKAKAACCKGEEWGQSTTYIDSYKDQGSAKVLHEEVTIMEEMPLMGEHPEVRRCSCRK